MNAQLVVQGGHRSDAFSVAFAPDSQTLASLEGRGVVKLWDVATGECRRAFGDSSRLPLLFTPDGLYLVTAHGNIVRFWNVASGQEAGRLTVEDAKLLGVDCAAFSPDGHWFALSGWNRGFVWRYADVVPLLILPPLNASAHFAYAPFPPAFTPSRISAGRSGCFSCQTAIRWLSGAATTARNTMACMTARPTLPASANWTSTI